MSAPDRSATVRIVVNAHRELFGTDDTRRGLLYYICIALNANDAGEWGVLWKGDRGGFIPSDVIVYRSTMEHFDVLKGEPDDPAWQPHGVITNPTWEWRPATVALFAPGTAPSTPAPPASEELAALLVLVLEPIERIADALSDLATAVNGGRDVALEIQRDGIRLKLK